MFVEPQPGSGFDKVAPAYIVRRLLGRLLGRKDEDETGPAGTAVEGSNASTRTRPSTSRSSRLTAYTTSPDQLCVSGRTTGEPRCRIRGRGVKILRLGRLEARARPPNGMTAHFAA
jgi:hypothetical protein